MAKADGMTTLKPDYTYGLRVNHHPIPDNVTVSAHIDLLLEVVPKLHHPSFIIEGKSDRGFKAEAENRACRGGAALVNTARQLLQTIGARDTEATGPDEHTFIYSATVSPGLMDFWVHWWKSAVHRPHHSSICIGSTLLLHTVMELPASFGGLYTTFSTGGVWIHCR